MQARALIPLLVVSAKPSTKTAVADPLSDETAVAGIAEVF